MATQAAAGPRMTVEERNSLCGRLGHPGATHNPWLDRTWCACGQRAVDGQAIVPHVACCGGPLDRHKEARDG